MNRRRFLITAGSTAAVGSIAGCTSGSGSSVDTSGVTVPTPVRGDPEAAVTVAVFKDFACSHCRRYTLDVLPPLEKNYIEPGAIRYEYHDFPIPVSDWSYRVANLGRAIQDEQGEDAFWAFEKRAFEKQAEFDWNTLESLAANHGVASDRVQSLATAKEYERIVEADRQRGADRGVSGTPTVFVNGRVVENWSYDNLAAAIDDAQ